MSFAQSIASQVKRFACDRCHGQKLRCPRPPDGDLHKPCVRCCKAGTRCRISTPPKMGRPNKSRKLDTGEGVPCHTTSSKSKSMSKTKTLETRTPSESDSENDQLGDQEIAKALVDQTSRCSSASPTPYHKSLAFGATTLSDIADSASPIVTNDFLQYLDFDLEFADTMDTGIYNDGISGLGAKSRISQEVEFPSATVFANTARQHEYAFPTDGDIPEETQFDPPPEEAAVHRFDEFPTHFLDRYNAYATLPEIASRQTSSTITAQSTVPPTPAKSPRPEENLHAQSRPSISTQPNLQDITFGSAKLFQAPSPPELKDSELVDRQLSEQKSLASLLQIQQQIYHCSEKIMQPNPSHQDNTSVLGRLFCATDRFISHISRNYTSPSSSTLNPASQSSSTLSNRANSSSTHALPPKSSILPLNHKETFDTCHDSSTLPSAAAFYIIMACHTRILTAYDAIISTTPSATVFPCESPVTSTAGECCFSIGSFTVRPGTSLESVLHLQVISHQLEHLNSALYHCMMTDASSLSSSSSLGSRNPSSNSQWARSNSSSLQDFAVQVVEQQGMMLKGKIVARITDAQGTSRNSVHQN